MCIPKSNHKSLIETCYPVPKSLGAAGPDFKPNSNELSRLAYYANTKPAKLTKVASVLLAKGQGYAKGLGGSGAASDKAKGGLMITLGIMKQLIVDCRTHLAYFYPAAQSLITAALDASARGGANGRRDLDVSARAASTFYALANYVEPATADASYLRLVQGFAALATEKGADAEDTARARLIGLGALSGATGSDAIYTASFSKQASIIIPALLANMLEGDGVDLTFLRQEGNKTADGTPTFAEYSFKRRPITARRAPSMSGTIASEKAPGPREAASAAMGTMHCLLHNGDASHVEAAVPHMIAFLDKADAYRSQRWCSWLAEGVTSWTALPYRFVVLNGIIEHLVESENPSPVKADALVHMTSTLLRSKLSLIGLSTSDTISNLLGLAVRRTHAAPNDALLPALVDCVGAIGTHTYYADQVNDCADEICARIAALLLPEGDLAEAGKLSKASNLRSRKPLKAGERARDESLRLLLCCLASLVDSANASPAAVNAAQAQGTVQAASARARISPDVLAPTCALLASPNARIRTTFQQAVLFFLKREATSASDTLPSAAQTQQGEANAFIHAWAAGAYVLSLSRALYVPLSTKENPLLALPIIDRANVDGTRAAMPETTAEPIDYSGLATTAQSLVHSLPVPATLGLVPALLALDKNAGARLNSTGVEDQRRSATHAVVAKALAAIAEKWDVPALAKIASSALTAARDILPVFPADMPELDNSPDVVPFPGGKAGAPSSSAGVDGSSVISALSSSAKLQRETSLGEAELRQWFSRDWSLQIAVDDAFVGASPFRSSLDGASARPFDATRAPAPAAAAADVPRAVGIDDFREALGSQTYSKRPPSSGGAAYASTRSASVPVAPDGTTSFDSGATTTTAAQRRTSRRVSRKEAATSLGVPALLDNLSVGMDENEKNEAPAKAALVAPTLV